MKWLQTHLEPVCQALILTIGARSAFLGRYSAISADGLSYLDVASAYLRHDWHTAINGYWGPLYSWLLAIAMCIVRPSVRLEAIFVRGVNFLIFAVALYTFQDCWHALANWNRRGRPGETIADVSPNGWILFGYALFVANFVWYIDMVTPDILVASVVFAVCASLFRMDNGGQSGLSADISLGLLLAAGFYAKAILLFFDAFVLSTLLRRRVIRRKLGSLVTLTVFALLVFPYVFALSLTLGRLTAGDSGKLNYAWFVDGPPTKTWMENAPDAAPIPFYPGRQIFHDPPAFQIPLLKGVTYAPWYDAARFATESRPRFSLHGELRQLRSNLRELQSQVLVAGAPLLVSLLVLLSYAPRLSLGRLFDSWMFSLPLLGVLSMYLLVHLVGRFTLGFLPLLWGIALAAAIIPATFRASARRTVLVGVAVFAASAFPGLAHSLWSPRDASAKTDIAIAEALPNYGIQPGDAVATIGSGEGAYWARLARVSIVAEVWDDDSDKFSLSLPSWQESLARSMAAAGARAVIWRTDRSRLCPNSWLPLPHSSGCILMLH